MFRGQVHRCRRPHYVTNPKKLPPALSNMVAVLLLVLAGTPSRYKTAAEVLLLVWQLDCLLLYQQFWLVKIVYISPFNLMFWLRSFSTNQHVQDTINIDYYMPWSMSTTHIRRISPYHCDGIMEARSTIVFVMYWIVLAKYYVGIYNRKRILDKWRHYTQA